MSSLKLPFPIVPAASGEPSHYSKYGVGGLHYVGSVENLADIPVNLKEPGMIVFVMGDQSMWFWTGSAWNNLEIAKASTISGDLEDIRNLLKWEEFE